MAMHLYHARGYWRRTKPYTRTLALGELVVAENEADAEAQALASWRKVWPTLDGEPVCASVTAVDRVGAYRVNVNESA